MKLQGNSSFCKLRDPRKTNQTAQTSGRYLENNTLPVKGFWTVRLLMFFKEVSSAHKACIYLIQSFFTI